MANYVIYNTSTGIVSQSCTGLQTPDISIPGFAFLETETEYDYKTSRVVNGAIVTIPEKPSANHEWINDGWVDQTPVAQLKQNVAFQITAERERRNNLPITYQNSLFDCDETAQRNIQAWTTNINAGTNPPAGFVWRDYNNVDHAADASFVLGLNAAVVARGTQLYQTSWTKKAEIDALTTAEAVSAYDVTTGW